MTRFLFGTEHQKTSSPPPRSGILECNGVVTATADRVIEYTIEVANEMNKILAADLSIRLIKYEIDDLGFLKHMLFSFVEYYNITVGTEM
jgi:hypothetical protein